MSDTEVTPEVIEYKACPFCAESILIQAVKCRYCHSDLATAERTLAAANADVRAQATLRPRQRAPLSPRAKRTLRVSGIVLVSGIALAYLLFNSPLTDWIADRMLDHTVDNLQYREIAGAEIEMPGASLIMPLDANHITSDGHPHYQLDINERTWFGNRSISITLGAGADMATIERQLSNLGAKVETRTVMAGDMPFHETYAFVPSRSFYSTYLEVWYYQKVNATATPYVLQVTMTQPGLPVVRQNSEKIIKRVLASIRAN